MNTEETFKNAETKPDGYTLLGNVLSVKDIAKKIANKANMPYCWEDIEDRLKKGYALPFKLGD